MAQLQQQMRQANVEEFGVGFLLLLLFVQKCRCRFSGNMYLLCKLECALEICHALRIQVTTAEFASDVSWSLVTAHVVQGGDRLFADEV